MYISYCNPCVHLASVPKYCLTSLCSQSQSWQPFSSISPDVNQSINTIDWMVNLLTTINQMQMKSRKKERSQIAGLLNSHVENGEGWGSKEKQRYHLKFYFSPTSCLWVLDLLPVCTPICMPFSFVCLLSSHLSVVFFLCLNRCTWDRICTVKTLILSLTGWQGVRAEEREVGS